MGVCKHFLSFAQSFFSARLLPRQRSSGEEIGEDLGEDYRENFFAKSA
jgi:hypothetical protein